MWSFRCGDNRKACVHFSLEASIRGGARTLLTTKVNDAQRLPHQFNFTMTTINNRPYHYPIMTSRTLLAIFSLCALALVVQSTPTHRSVRQDVPPTIPVEETLIEEPADTVVDQQEVHLTDLSAISELSSEEPGVEDDGVISQSPADDEGPFVVMADFPEETTVPLLTAPIDELPSSTEEPSPDPEMPDFQVYNFGYNIGGNTTRGFEADPTDWIVGETSVFEVKDAEVVGDEKYAEVYKSHRYGLLGSTWGYDFKVPQAGLYACTLFYAETYSENFSDEPNRTFTVEIYGDGSEEVQSQSFDVMVELEGAEFTAYTRKFRNIAVATTLSLREAPAVGDAFLAGIRCSARGPLMMA